MPADPLNERALTRRDFLEAGLAVVGSLVVAGGALGTAEPAAALDTKTFFPLVLSPWLYASPTPQRIVVALGHNSSHGIKYASGPSVKIRFRGPKRAKWTPLTKTTYDRAGLPKGRGVYVTAATFDTAGVWRADARALGQKVPFTLQVNDAPAGPIAGQPAPRVPSPTPTDTLGVDPICTRDPICPLHNVSLSTVIGSGKPAVALFATPARCQSQYCGPVLDELLKVMKPYQDRATFVHIEIYRALTGTALVPTVDAWQLPGEPVLFGIDGTGTVRSRIEGAMGGDEMKKLIETLL